MYQKAEEIFQQVEAFIEEEYGKDAEFVGSAARETSLKNDVDLDIFVLFEKNIPEHQFEEKGIEIGEAVIEEFGSDKVIEYAEHPYVKGSIEGFDVDIVPAYDVEPENISSSVDRTPHHSEWVQENLSDQQRQDVVVLKQFLNANDLYGSSQKRLGFSGYLCEVLIHEYGSFGKLMGEAREWSEKQLIDPEGHWEDSSYKEVSQNFDNEDFIVVDPVDPQRNVASVLSQENLAKFVFLAIKFVDNPSTSFFEKGQKEVTDEELFDTINRRANILVVEFDKPDIVESKLYPQARKLKRLYSQKLQDRGFTVYEDGVWAGSQEVRLIFETDLPDRGFEEKIGPKPLHKLSQVRNYLDKHPDSVLNGTRLVDRKPREFNKPEAFIRHLRETEDPRDIGVPKHFEQIFYDQRIVNPESGSKSWRNYLYNLLEV